MNNIKQILGKNISRYRKAQKLTQSQLAEKIGIDVKKLSRIETGHNYPNSANLAQISDILNTTPWKLFYESPKISVDEMRNFIISSIKNDKIATDLYLHLKTLKKD